MPPKEKEIEGKEETKPHEHIQDKQIIQGINAHITSESPVPVLNMEILLQEEHRRENREPSCKEGKMERKETGKD